MTYLQLIDQIIDAIEDMDRPTAPKILDYLEDIREDFQKEFDDYMEEFVDDEEMESINPQDYIK